MRGAPALAEGICLAKPPADILVKIRFPFDNDMVRPAAGIWFNGLSDPVVNNLTVKGKSESDTGVRLLSYPDLREPDPRKFSFCAE